MAYDSNGGIVRRIGTNDDQDPVESDDYLEHGTKKTYIINAWLELGKRSDVSAITSILPVSEQYVRTITNQLDDGSITPAEYRQELDWDIREMLAERFETYDKRNRGTETATETTHSLMSLTVNADQERGAKKRRIINAWLVDDELGPSVLVDVLDSGYEYIRSTLKALNNGEIDQEEIEDAADEQLQEQIRIELENIGHEVESESGSDDSNPTPRDDSSETASADEDEERQGVLGDSTKKARILNSVLIERESDMELNYTEMAGAADCSEESARRLTREVSDGDITDEDLQEASDEGLQDALPQYYEANDIIELPADDAAELATEIEIDLAADNPFDDVDLTKRDVLVDIFEFDATITPSVAADLAGASESYAQRTYSGIQNDEYDPDEYHNEEIHTALEALQERGELAGNRGAETGDSEPVTASEPDIESPSNRAAPGYETTGEVRYAAGDTPSPDETVEVVPASEIRQIRDVADMLYRQAEYEGEGDPKDKKAEFIAKELRDRPDKILAQGAE